MLQILELSWTLNWNTTIDAERSSCESRQSGQLDKHNNNETKDDQLPDLVPTLPTHTARDSALTKSQPHQSQNCQPDHLFARKDVLLHLLGLMRDSTPTMNTHNRTHHRDQTSAVLLRSKVLPPSTVNQPQSILARLPSQVMLVLFVAISDQQPESISTRNTRMYLVTHQTIRHSTVVARIALTVLDLSAQQHPMVASLAGQQQTAEKVHLHHHPADQKSPRHHLQSSEPISVLKVWIGIRTSILDLFYCNPLSGQSPVPHCFTIRTLKLLATCLTPIPVLLPLHIQPFLSLLPSGREDALPEHDAHSKRHIDTRSHCTVYTKAVPLHSPHAFVGVLRSLHYITIHYGEGSFFGDGMS